MSAIKYTCGALLLLGLAGCNTALPPGTLVQPGYGPPPPPRYYAPPPVYAAPPPPPPRCFYRDGFYGPERVCRSYY